MHRRKSPPRRLLVLLAWLASQPVDRHRNRPTVRLVGRVAGAR